MFEACKYNGKWSVFDRKSKVYYFIGCGKKFCEKKVKELNSGLDLGDINQGILQIKANRIADEILCTNVNDRGKLFQLIGERLKLNAQGYTGSLFIQIANQYNSGN